MKTFYNTTFEIRNLNETKFNLLIDFLEDNNIDYEQTDFEEFEIDKRSEQEKYDDWLSEQADLHNDNVKMGLE